MMTCRVAAQLKRKNLAAFLLGESMRSETKQMLKFLQPSLTSPAKNCN